MSAPLRRMLAFFRKREPEFRGYVDESADGHVRGWVWDRGDPGRRLEVEIHAAGQPLGVARGDSFRQDLLDHGVGDGRYGFVFELPEGDFPRETIAAKIAGAEHWLIDGARADGFAADAPLNSARRGLALLRPGLSLHCLNDEDVAVAADLLAAWRRCAPHRRADSGASAPSSIGAMWSHIVSARHDRLSELLAGDDPKALAAFLVDVHKSAASEGIAQGASVYADFVNAGPQARRAAVAPFHDMLVSLAQYLCVLRGECAEQDFAGEGLASDQAELARAIEEKIAIAIAPPSVFDGFFGLAVDDRVLHGRDIQALYAALRAIESSGRERPSICEIGGGFGQVARYAMLLGARRYTIVDLPTVAAMQYFFLRRAAPQLRVSLLAAQESPPLADGVDLVLAENAASAAPRADILLNCDSFPEMGDAVCETYFSMMADWAPLLLSVNQEANRAIGATGQRQSVVGALLQKHGYRRRYRFRSWVRRGYIEELWATPAPEAGPAA